MSELWLQNLGAFSLQIGLVAVLTGTVAACSRFVSPRVLLYFHQAALAVALLAPALQPWHPVEQSAQAWLPSEAAAGSLLVLARRPVDVPAIAAWVLAIGVIGRIGWLTLGCWRLRRYRRAATPLDHTFITAAGFDSRAAAGVRWFASPDIFGPATYGLRRPVILLPEGLAESAPATARAIAAHELVHVHRRDWPFVMLEEIIRAALWFHPGVWWLLDRIHLHREQTVDQEAAAIIGDRRAYLTALLDSAVISSGMGPSPAPAWLRRRHLKARILSAMKEVPMSRRRLCWSAAGLALVLTSGATAAAVAFPLGTPAGATLTGQQQQPAQVYDPGNGVTLPVLVKEVRPQYTPAAMQAKVQGTVLLSCVVRDDGKIGDVTVIRSLDAEHGLDDQAVAAAKQWEFKPGTKGGTPVAVRITIELRFTLK